MEGDISSPQYWLGLLNFIPQAVPLLSLTAVVVLIIFGLRFFFLRFVLPRVRSQQSRLLWRRNSTYLGVFLSLVIIFPIWLPSLRSLLTILGIFGAGVLIVLKEVILNLAGWFYIIVRKPFEVGNRIEINHNTGDVIDIRLLEFAIMEIASKAEGGQSTGRVIHMPNSLVFTQPLANASKEFAFTWNEINIPISPDSDWRRAVLVVEKVAQQTVESIAESDHRLRKSEEEYAISFRKTTPRVYVEFKPGSIILSLRHLAEPRNRRHITDLLWRGILTSFEKEKKIKLSTLPYI